MIKKVSCYKWIVLAIFIAIMTPVYSQAQNIPDSTQTKVKRISFGFGFGFNVSGLSVAGNPDYTVKVTPFAGAILHTAASIFLNQRLDLTIHAGISFHQRDIDIHSLATNTEGIFKVESIMVESPIALKYKFLPEKNRTPYCLIGFSPRVDLVGKELIASFAMSSTRLLRPYNLDLDIGVGMDYLLRGVKLGVELKFSLGLLNVNQTPIKVNPYPSYNLYAAAIKSSYSRLLILCFNIE